MAGSYLAALLSSSGFRVTVYEAAGEYAKPCGEVVPLIAAKQLKFVSRFVEFDRLVSALISEFEVGVVAGSRRSVAALTFGKPVWAVIDKKSLVQSMREAAVGYGAELKLRSAVDVHKLLGRFDVVVDARGPFAAPLSARVPAYRVLVRVPPGADAPRSRAKVVFDFGRLGISWVFPSPRGGNVFSVGAGFARRVPGLRGLVMRLAGTSFGGYEVVEEGGSVLAFTGPSLGEVVGRGRLLARVGEAAGFVHATTGEGIRQALLSAEALYESLSSGSEPEAVLSRYAELSRRLRGQAALHSRVLGLVRRLPPRFVPLDLPRSFWEKLLRGDDLTYRDLARALLKV